MIKLRAFLTLFMASAIAVLSAQTLTIKQEKEKFGYADASGKMVIKAQYNKAFPFDASGKAKVSKNDKWGYIDKQGLPIIKVEYDEIGEFKNGIARVKKGKKYGYIKENGSIYIKPDFNFIGTPNEDGWIWVGQGKSLATAKIGLYRNDKVIIKPLLCYLGFYFKTDSIDYTDGRPVSILNGAPKNNEITKNFQKLTTSSKPYIWVFGMGRTAVFDTEGKLIVKGQSGAVGMPHDGYSIIRSYNSKKNTYSYNYISADTKNQKLFKKDIVQQLDDKDVYESCAPFNGGVAMCGNEKEAYLINTSGKSITPTYSRLIQVRDLGFISRQGDRYGLLSTNGSVNVTPTYSLILKPIEGSEILPAKESVSGKYGFIDFQGNEKVSFRYEDAIAFSHGKGYVKENGAYGIIDANGKYIVKNVWAKIQPATSATSDYVWVMPAGKSKWQCIQLSTDKLSFNKEYDAVLPFNNKNQSIIRQGDYFGAVNNMGSTVLPSRFNSQEIAEAALLQLEKDGKNSMTETDAYRFNIYNNTERHQLQLKQAVAADLWDF